MSVAVDSSQELNRMTKPALTALASGLQNRVQELESDNAELKKALGESEASRALLAEAVESLAEGFVIFDSEERMVLCNRKYREIYYEIADRLAPGVTFEEVVNYTARHCKCLDSEAAIETWAKERIIQYRESPGRSQQQLKDGRWLMVQEDRLPNGWTVGIRSDISELMRRETELRESEARYREIFEESPVSLWVEDWAPLRHMLDDLASRGVTDLLGYFRDNPDELNSAYDAPEVVDTSHEAMTVYRAPTASALIAFTNSTDASPEEIEGFTRQLAGFFEGARSWEYEARETACDGSPIVTRIRTVIPPRYDDTWSRVLVSIEDITEKRANQDALVENEIRYRELFEESPVAMLEEDWRPVKRLLDDLTRQGVTDLESYFEDNPNRLGEAYEAADRFGVSQAAVKLYRASSKKELWAAMTEETADPDELEGYGRMIAAFYGGAKSFEYEADEIACDGTEIVTRIRCVIPPKYLDNWSRVLVTMEDITDRRRAEEQLRQAQKLQVVGQLTGGIAHDFNNLLAVIMGNAEILRRRLGDDGQPAESVLQAASRGAELTQRLLAFSRAQPLQPQALSLADLLANMNEMLRRTLGETIDIKSGVSADLWPALADPGQLENALLNLAINARDAMRGGGTLVFEAANKKIYDQGSIARSGVKPGHYVVCAVSDTGCGMSPEVIERVFEPFFTTKDVGAGSGLGLSMVYGFIRQSDGHVAISSKEGRGTTVTLYLPRAEPDRDLATDHEDSGEPGGSGETILILEDDPDVRSLVISLLEDLGYRVLSAPDGAAALSILETMPGIDLLLSDVVLPRGMSGPEVVKRARQVAPAIKVLFMSGYAEQAMRHRKSLEGGTDLLNKPFRRSQLARGVRKALDG